MPPRKRAEPKGAASTGPAESPAGDAAPDGPDTKKKGAGTKASAKKLTAGKATSEKPAVKQKTAEKKAVKEKAVKKSAVVEPQPQPVPVPVPVSVPEQELEPVPTKREQAPLSAAAIHAIITGTHGDPFGVLGIHEVAGGEVLRAFLPGAERVEAISPEGATLATLERRHDAGFFEGPVHGRPRYLLRATRGDDRWTIDDPYAYSPVLGPMDDWLLGEGTHAHLYDRLGAHLMTHQGSAGVHFALWAPNARRVSVVGNFNRWDGRRHVMRKRHGTGVWEIFVPGLGEGTMYKYELTSAGGRLMPLKSDPVGFGAELRPSTASVVRDTEHFVWNDQEWMRSRAAVEVRRAPMAAYEVHLGSWQRGDQGQWLTYDELADRLVPYVKAMGFTHVELMPVNEHPLDKSWGYQPVGMFAPTARFGEPAAFARFVDRCHVEGIGVIIDWVPAHFPVDAHGLARFDGTALYEHEDPRLGFHPDWNTAIYNFGRREVCNFLIASALFWLDRYHIDGLRVDAVASMLYLDYSRKDGEWIPNRFGGRENLEAVAFVRRMNEAVYGRFPGAFTIAEESTAWPAVSRPTFDGGLGFGLKWNMGWMHDTLDYMAEDPVHRRWHHNKMTFGMMYAFTENFVLPLSHDEVVHGKGSLLARFPGDAWRKFAGLRAYLALTWAYPGKKLLFMGGEFGQGREWDFDGSLDWQLLDVAWHRGVQGLMKDCNRVMRAEGALHERDCEGEGFQWIVVDDAAASVFAWVRRGAEGTRPVVVVSNLTPIPRPSYKLGLPLSGRWTEVLNTDAGFYGGSNVGNAGGVVATEEPSHGYPCSTDLTIPPLATLWLVHEG